MLYCSVPSAIAWRRIDVPSVGWFHCRKIACSVLHRSAEVQCMSLGWFHKLADSGSVGLQHERYVRQSFVWSLLYITSEFGQFVAIVCILLWIINNDEMILHIIFQLWLHVLMEAYLAFSWSGLQNQRTMTHSEIRWQPRKRLNVTEVCSWQGTIQIHVYLTLPRAASRHIRPAAHRWH